MPTLCQLSCVYVFFRGTVLHPIWRSTFGRTPRSCLWLQVQHRSPPNSAPAPPLSACIFILLPCTLLCTLQILSDSFPLCFGEQH